MASVTKHAERDGWVLQFRDHEKRKRKLWIGKATKRQAEAIGFYVSELVRCKNANIAAGPDVTRWANELGGRMRERLVAWDLADPVSPKLTTDAGKLLGPFLDAYIAGRSDVKASTRTNYKQTRRLLVEYFDDKRTLRSITPADADRWRRWLLSREVKAKTETTPAETMAVASVSKHVKRAKTMLAEAVNDRLLTESPFSRLKGGDESNPDRHRFIDQVTAAHVLGACPDADWRLIFSLARWGGLRCPSEVLSLRWSDVDWERGRLRIDSSKTGLRHCPLFPELRAALAEAFDAAPEGAVWCVTRYRGGLANLRTQLGRILSEPGYRLGRNRL